MDQSPRLWSVARSAWILAFGLTLFIALIVWAGLVIRFPIVVECAVITDDSGVHQCTIPIGTTEVWYYPAPFGIGEPYSLSAAPGQITITLPDFRSGDRIFVRQSEQHVWQHLWQEVIHD